jgi:hypothetical protein
MKITICGSMFFSKEMLLVKTELEKAEHTVFVPSDVHDCAENPDLAADVEHCLRTNVQEECFNNVANSDAILVLNYKKNGIEGYIGGATLMEIGIAQHLKKKIFLLNPVPKVEDLRYSVEIQIAKPVILNGNLNLIS